MKNTKKRLTLPSTGGEQDKPASSKKPELPGQIKALANQKKAEKRTRAKANAKMRAEAKAEELRRPSQHIADAIAKLQEADFTAIQDLQIADLVSELEGFATVTGVIPPGNLLIRQRCEIVDSSTMRNSLIRKKGDVSYLRGDILARLVKEGKIKMGRANYPEDPAFYGTFAYGFHNSGVRRSQDTVHARAICFTESNKGFVDSQCIATGFWRVVKPIHFLAVLEKNDPGNKALFRHAFVKVVTPPDLTADTVASTEYLADIFAQDVPKGSEYKYRPSAFFARMSFANGVQSIAYSSVKAKELNHEGRRKEEFPEIVNLVLPPEVAEECLELETVWLTEMVKTGEKQFSDLVSDSYLALPANGKGFREDEEFDWQLQAKPDRWIQR